MTTNCKIQLKGFLGQNPKLINPENGKEFAVLSVATTDSYKDKNGQWQKKETLWHDVILFNPKLLNAVKELKKGDSVNIKGTLFYKHVETKEGFTVPQASIQAYAIEKNVSSIKQIAE